MSSPTAFPLLIPANHPAYAGHFPGKPILPGVVLLDAALHELITNHTDQMIQLQTVKFLHPVLPGEVLVLLAYAKPGNKYDFEIRSHFQCANEHCVMAGNLHFSQKP